MIRRALPLVVVGACTLAWAARADWPQFRGPGGLGVSADANVPVKWSATSNVVWKTELPGSGASSPIVVGKNIFVTCYAGYGDYKGDGDMKELKRLLVCLGRDGKIVWQRAVEADLPEGTYDGYTALHGYASSTPASDGSHVYAFFGKSGVVAFDTKGQKLWQQSVGTGKHGWGSGTSPVLYKDLVIVNASVESGSLVALNKKDGSVAWTAKGLDHSWNTPLLVTLPDGKHEVVVSSYTRVFGYDPKSGAELWSCEGIQDYVCPSIIAKDGVVYVIGARDNTAMAIRAGGKGDVSKTNVVWEIKKGSNVSSPVLHEGHLYWASDNRGVIYCVEASKGTLVYEQRLQPAPDRIYASPVVAGGKIYFVSRNNGTYVLAAQPKFALLAHNTLDDDSVFNASPAVSDGQLLLRSDRYLYCLAK